MGLGAVWLLLVKLCIYDTTWKVVVHLINFTFIFFFVCFLFHWNHKLLVWFVNVTLIVCLESVKSGPYSNDHIGWNYFLLFFPDFNVSFLLKSCLFFYEITLQATSAYEITLHYFHNYKQTIESDES